MSLRPIYLSDPFEFARRASRLDGRMDARGLERLGDVLLDIGSEQPLSYVVSGWREGDRSHLELSIEGEVVLRCQRCLGEMRHVVDVEARLLLVPKDEQLPDEGLEDDSCDPVHAGRDFDVLAAIEDELLLVLPIAPLHAHDCAARQDEAGAGKPSPFAALAALKRKS